jgi:hypothetical protein
LVFIKDSTDIDEFGNKTARYIDDQVPVKEKTQLLQDIDDCLSVVMDKAKGDNVKACSIIASLITALSAKIANESNEVNIQFNIDCLSEYMQIIVNMGLHTLANEIEELIVQKKILRDNEKYK